eukprot:TRINITY_DN17375_c0_g1_i1.p9 TRINITY_DN17375_c0_g1~~TRINITY_DN17375_c0_g1_i1.p9  ORF type:complete len:112 (-),score=7.44 TRINITY_DN17375_c0_g1_i1:225-560(-)
MRFCTKELNVKYRLDLFLKFFVCFKRKINSNKYVFAQRNQTQTYCPLFFFFFFFGKGWWFDYCIPSQFCKAIFFRVNQRIYQVSEIAFLFMNVFNDDLRKQVDESYSRQRE